MEHRLMGSDLTVSVVGLGCNNFGTIIDEDRTREVVAAALDVGITHFDTAEMYGEGRSEELLGAALGRARDDVVVASKALPRPPGEAYEPGALARRIVEGCEGSLRRLGTDRIDVYYHHFPDPEAPADEALEALSGLVRSGKVLHIACSNYRAEQLRDAAGVSSASGTASYCANQVEWSLINRSAEASVVPAARELGVAVVPYFPLASGLLTGKYRRGEQFPAGSRLAFNDYFAQVASDENFTYLERLIEFAESLDHTILELAIAWLLAQDTVPSVIAGATSAEQIKSNVSAAEWRLSPAELAAVPTR